MKLSIVTTLYNSSPYVKEFYRRMSIEAKKISNDYEIILVDDGSTDNSLAQGLALQKKDSKLKLIQLSRNFGHHKAIMTGLSYAKGSYVFLIDSDLEEEPELLGSFWETIQKNLDLDVVYGVQESRNGGWFERWSGNLFYKIFNFLSDTKIPHNPLLLRLMSKKFVKELITNKDKSIFIGGLFIHTGFNQSALFCNKKHKGRTTYTLFKKFSQSAIAIVSFSSKPLYYVFYVGIFLSIVSFFSIAYLVINKLFFAVAIDGWTSLIVSVYLLGGLVIAGIGVVGIYLAKVYEEVKDRPLTIIKNTWGLDR